MKPGKQLSSQGSPDPEFSPPVLGTPSEGFGAAVEPWFCVKTCLSAAHLPMQLSLPRKGEWGENLFAAWKRDKQEVCVLCWDVGLEW